MKDLLELAVSALGDPSPPVARDDVAAAKLLIYTRQVDVNMPAPKGKKQTPLQLAEAATHEHKDRLIELLRYVAGISAHRRLAVFPPVGESKVGDAMSVIEERHPQAKGI